MRKIILLGLAASVLSVGGCQKQSSPDETPAVTNAVPATPAVTNAVPAPPMTNGPAKKAGSGV